MKDVRDIIAPDEEVSEVVYRHGVSVAPIMAVTGVLSIISLAGFYFLGRYHDTLPSGTHALVLALGLVALLVLGLMLAVAGRRIMKENRLILTNRNLYQVTQNSLLSRRVSQFSLELMQDVAASQQGLFANLLHYGDVAVETAGEHENFVFRQVRDPHHVASLIMAAHRNAANQANTNGA